MGIIRFLLPFFPVGDGAKFKCSFGNSIIYHCQCFACGFWCSWDIKRIIAYSSISHMVLLFCLACFSDDVLGFAGAFEFVIESWFGCLLLCF
jgi:NADH:ubiquinone oxidoreductase subunit 4 (subunit M)